MTFGRLSFMNAKEPKISLKKLSEQWVRPRVNLALVGRAGSGALNNLVCERHSE